MEDIFEKNMKSDFNQFFRDLLSNAKKEEIDDLFLNYKYKFRHFYQIPRMQKFLSHLYFNRKLILLGNSYFQMRFNKKKDKYSHETIIRSLFEFRSNIRKKIKSKIKGHPVFLLRVDDFPRWDLGLERFLEFHNILKKNNIPYLLGVTPFLSEDPLDPNQEKFEYLTPEEIEILNQIGKENCAFALHGLTHQTLSKRLHTETIGLKQIEIEKKIKKALNALKKDGIKPKYLIPPFNTFDINSLKVFKKYFTGICAGPETIPTLGFRVSPTKLDDVYLIHSYSPLYNKAENIIPFLEILNDKYYDRIIAPITIHWSWELGDNFESIRKLCTLIKNRTYSWDKIFKEG